MTDIEGKVQEVIGIETKEKKIAIASDGKDIYLSVKPNAVYNSGDNFRKAKIIEFNYPLQN